MFESVSAPKAFTTEDFLSSHNVTLVDDTVTEVFGMMLGFAVTPVDGLPADAGAGDVSEKTAIVGLSGSMRGCCEVRMISGAARSITSAMLGGDEIGEEEDTIADAIGEICNMIAGGWKNRIPTLSSTCSLSPPTVISGRDYTLHMSTPSVKVSRAYSFDVHTFRLTVQCENSSVS